MLPKCVFHSWFQSYFKPSKNSLALTQHIAPMLVPRPPMLLPLKLRALVLVLVQPETHPSISKFVRTFNHKMERIKNEKHGKSFSSLIKQYSTHFRSHSVFGICSWARTHTTLNFIRVHRALTFAHMNSFLKPYMLCRFFLLFSSSRVGFWWLHALLFVCVRACVCVI